MNWVNRGAIVHEASQGAFWSAVMIQHLRLVTIVYAVVYKHGHFGVDSCIDASWARSMQD